MATDDKRHKLALEIIASVKELNGYSDEVRQCSSCSKYIERENSHVDRMWDPVCTLISGPIGIDIPVKPTGHCHQWAKKEGK